MGLFNRRAKTSAYPAQDKAEESFEHDEGKEFAYARRGLRFFRWGLRDNDDDVARREMRAAGDRESDSAEELFIESERHHEERGPGESYL
ncbi:MAG: hypothetical protein ACRDV0_00930 [Acidimicrobiales bacterium]